VLARAALGESGLALRAATAIQRRLHRISDAVDESGEFVAEGEVERPKPEEGQIGSANAAGGHFQQQPITRRFIDLDDGRAVTCASYCSHGGQPLMTRYKQSGVPVARDRISVTTTNEMYPVHLIACSQCAGG
jgi:hypothetical protein